MACNFVLCRTLSLVWPRPVWQCQAASRHCVWFDEDQHDGIYHQDWQLEGDSAARAAFKAAAEAS
jgi:hypothetical protein